MAAGTYDDRRSPEGHAAEARAQDFSCSSAVTTFEDLFLAGGLRQGWRTALEVADLAVGAPVRPAGLAELLRLLVRYAPEVPDRTPRHCRRTSRRWRRTRRAPRQPWRLARWRTRSASRSTSSVPSRRLPRGAHRCVGPRGAAHAGAAVDGVAGRRPDRGPRRRPRRPARPPVGGLQRLGTVVRRRLLVAHALRARPVPDLPDRARTGSSPPRSAPSTATGRRGRAATLHGIERQYGPVDVVAAVDAWVDDALDAGTFWRLARDQVVSVPDMRDRWRARGASPTTYGPGWMRCRRSLPGSVRRSTRSTEHSSCRPSSIRPSNGSPSSAPPRRCCGPSPSRSC